MSARWAAAGPVPAGRPRVAVSSLAAKLSAAALFTRAHTLGREGTWRLSMCP